MKNIHLIPTDKPSRLYYNNNDLELQFCELCKETTPLKENRNIYITSAEEITDGDWGLSKLNEVILFGINYNKNLYKKIILTTDPKLINDGVQGIDDEFLEWFVKNPSCEKLEINWIIEAYSIKKEYTIVIPKQETLEEVAEKWFNEQGFNIYNHYDTRPAFIEGAKWQQEQYRWKTVSEETPPNNIELLVKSPEGVVHLSNWRESYNIFTCQAKSESSYNWKWKKI